MKVFNLFFAALFVTFVFIKCTGDQQSSSTTTSDTTKTSAAKAYVPKVHKPAPQLTYTLDSSKKLLKSDSLTENQWNILTAINRTDRDNIKSFKAILVPSDMNGDVENYLPFPATVPGLKNVSKLLMFSYPAQAFAAYEYGDLVYTGPTNMGRKKRSNSNRFVLYQLEGRTNHQYLQ